MLLAAAVTAASPAFGKSKTDYKSELEDKTSSLREVQQSLKEKRLEKERILLEEKRARREIGRIVQEQARLQKKGETLRREIRKAQKKLATAEKELKLAGWEKKQWTDAFVREINSWYRGHHSCYRLYADPLAEELRMQALVQKKHYVNDAMNKERLSQRSLERWQAARTRLSELKGQQENTLAEQAKFRLQKEEFLKTTVGRRVLAEEEIERLLESARALEQLILKLEREKKKSEQEDQERRDFQGRKKYLRWPVSGDVVLSFGRNKHPELDTYIISNGIKIKTEPGADIRAVSRAEVIFCGEFRSYGQMIILDHGGGFYSIYGQVGEIQVEEGQKVNEGDTIGKVVRTGQPVLYFELRSENQPEDPLRWLK